MASWRPLDYFAPFRSRQDPVGSARLQALLPSCPPPGWESQRLPARTAALCAAGLRTPCRIVGPAGNSSIRSASNLPNAACPVSALCRLFRTCQNSVDRAI